VKINIKPLSVNQCWQGKRFKTPLYKKFEKILLKNLPNYNIPDGLLELKLTFGLSSKNAVYKKDMGLTIGMFIKQ